MYTCSSFFLGKVTALGVLCCFALFVCLTLLASFFIPSHLSFKNMYIHVHVYSRNYLESVIYRLRLDYMYIHVYIQYIRTCIYTCEYLFSLFLKLY